MRKSVNPYLDNAQLAAIGNYAAHWAYFETELEFTMTAMNMLVHDKQTIPFPFGDRMKYWRSILPKAISSRHAVKYYDGIIRLAKKAHETRTRVLHGRVLGDDSHKTRYISTEHHQHRNGKWTSETFFATPKSLNRASNRLAQTTYSLIKAVMDCHGRHPHHGGGSDQHQKRLERGFGGFCHDDPRQIALEKILFLIRHALGCGILRSRRRSLAFDATRKFLVRRRV